MKAKKVLAVALAAAMAFSALPGMSVKADEISSGTVYIEQDVINVILPTTESQKFYIDPQGLIALGKGGATVADEGLVTGKSEMYAVNKSSMPLALSVNYKLKDSATTNGVTITTDAATAADVKDATGMAIAVYVAAEQSGVYEVASGSATATGSATGAVVKAGTDGLVSGTGVALTGPLSKDEVYASAAGTPENYFMANQSYKAQLKSTIATGDATKIYDSSSYEYVIDPDADDASCVKLTIGGYCAKEANWSAYAKGTETLKLDVTFKFKKLTKVAGQEKYYLAANAEEAQTGAGYLASKTISASSLSLKPTLPTGVTVSSIVLNSAAVNSGADTTLAGGGKHFTSASGTYTFNETMIKAWKGGTLTFNYSDGKKDVVTIQ